MAVGIKSSSSWSRLPDDLICLIMNRLYFVDLIRFRAVCKSWRKVSIEGIVKPADIFPWMMAFDSDSCHLYDPSHKQKYTVNEPSPGIFINPVVLASKYGWILFAKTRQEDFVLTKAKLFLYTPFGNQMIQLPKFKIMHHDKATFTASLDSPNCQIFIAYQWAKKFIIYTCRPGDKRWTKLIKFSFDEFSVEEFRQIYNLEYADGVLYCSYQQTAMAAFNIALKVLKKFPYPCKGIDNGFSDYLIETGGTLLLCHGFNRNFIRCHESNRYSVFKLDQSESEMKWIRVQNLDNRSLFLNDYTPLFTPGPMNEKSELANTIHLDCCSYYYSVCAKISKIYDWQYGHLKHCCVQLPLLR